MPLAKDVYKALEDIVGPMNISEEPAVLDSYAFQYFAELVRDGKKFMTRPEAVILPGSTEEVQAIVKTCNRYKVKFKAFSNGWGAHNAPRTEGVVQLDLRRMDHVLEIDEKNQFAVIEPYVINATLQAEAMKVGLNTHIIGAGASCSPLATATSFAGAGPDSIFMGFSLENLLASEWVMPDGEVLRTGSLGSGLGWFCGDGPGPSTRGILRGARGAGGGFGVHTKCAIKLYPWPGPPTMPVEGTVPVYKSPLEKNIRAYTLAFPDWHAYANAYYQIYDNEIGYIAHRQFIMWGEDLQAAVLKIVTDKNKQLCDLEELLATPEVKELTKELKYSFQLVLAGMTPRDIEYQEKVLDRLLAETGGWKVKSMAEPEMEKWSLLYLIRLCFKNYNFIYGGGFTDTCAIGGTPAMAFAGAPDIVAEFQRKVAKKGGIVDLGGDAGMGAASGLGGGGACSFEPFVLYDPADPESSKAAWQTMLGGHQLGLENGLMPAGYLIWFQLSPEIMQKITATQPAYRWQRKILEAFDPNDMGDGSYMQAEELSK